MSGTLRLSPASNCATLSLPFVLKEVHVRTRGLLFLGLLGMFPAVALALGIESVTLRADDADEAVEVFLPTDKKLHFDIALDETETGNHEFLVEFWAVDTSAGKDIRVGDFKANSLVTNTINASLTLPRDWPTGLYRLDVKMDGELIGSHEYDVAEPE
jgi:hypothetical protein